MGINTRLRCTFYSASSCIFLYKSYIFFRSEDKAKSECCRQNDGQEDAQGKHKFPQRKRHKLYEVFNVFSRISLSARWVNGFKGSSRMASARYFLARSSSLRRK